MTRLECILTWLDDVIGLLFKDHVKASPPDHAPVCAIGIVTKDVLQRGDQKTELRAIVIAGRAFHNRLIPVIPIDNSRRIMEDNVVDIDINYTRRLRKVIYTRRLRKVITKRLVYTLTRSETIQSVPDLYQLDNRELVLRVKSWIKERE